MHNSEDNPYSISVLDAVKTRWMEETRSLPHTPLFLADVISAQERSLHLASTPLEIVKAYGKIEHFAKVITSDEILADQVEGGFITGLPISLVPQALKTNLLPALAIPEIVRYQKETLDQLRKEVDSTEDQPWACSTCIAKQLKNTSPEVDLLYLQTFCPPCEIKPGLKAKRVKLPLIDFDIMIVTRGQLDAASRRRLWELAERHGFAPIYKNLDKVFRCEMDPIDIMLFEGEEIDSGFEKILTQREWYKQVVHPYDVFRYGSIAHNSKQPMYEIGNLAAIKMQPFGSQKLQNSFRETMEQLSGYGYLEDDLLKIFSGEMSTDEAGYLDAGPIWPPHYGRIFLENGVLHPLLKARLDGFKKASEPQATFA